MKPLFCAAFGAAGGIAAYLLGGWDGGLITLLLFMAVDYLSGITVAGLFRKSPKTEHGALSSNIGMKGLVKKGMVFAVIIIAHRLDAALGVSFCRDGATMAFVLNEGLSIIENAGIMGVPIPNAVKKAIELLNEREGGG